MAIDEEQLPRLQARIASLAHLRDPIRAMRALAVARLQEAQAAMPGSRGHLQTVERAIRRGAALSPAGSPAPGKAGPAGQAVVVAIGSEHGFAGGFNDRALDRAVTALAEIRAEGAFAGPAGLGVVGLRAVRVAAERGLAPAWTLPMAIHVSGATALARTAADLLAEAGRVTLVHARHSPGAGPAMICRQIMPLPPDLAAAAGPPPLHHLPPAVLWQCLAGEYLFAALADALVQSFAAENAARLQAMDSADRNIGDRLDVLHRRESSLRQEAVTADMLDVLTGQMAILD